MKKETKTKTKTTKADRVYQRICRAEERRNELCERIEELQEKLRAQCEIIGKGWVDLSYLEGFPYCIPGDPDYWGSHPSPMPVPLERI